MDIWKFRLIGRLDLSKIKLEVVKQRMIEVWKPKGECKLIPMGKGFFHH